MQFAPNEKKSNARVQKEESSPEWALICKTPVASYLATSFSLVRISKDTRVCLNLNINVNLHK